MGRNFISTERVTRASKTATTTWSWYAWYRIASTTGNRYPFALGTFAELEVYLVGGAYTPRVFRRTTGTGGEWTATSAIPQSATIWNFLCITQDGINDPIMRYAEPGDVALTTLSTSEGSTPTGTATTTSGHNLVWGNYDGSAPFVGDVAWCGFHNVVLTESELFDEAFLLGSVARGAVDLSLRGSETKNFVDDDAGTVTGSPDVTDTDPEFAGDEPTIVAGTAAAVFTGTSVTPTLPAHAADDILVAQGWKNDAADLSVATSGWAEVVADLNSANLSSGWWWKRATSGAETNPQIDSSTSATVTAGLFGRCFVVSNAATSGDPFEDATVNGSPTSSTTPAGATVTTTDVDRLAVTFAAIDAAGAYASGLPPASWTTVDDDAVAY